jgi:Na+/glutamate symporter
MMDHRHAFAWLGVALLFGKLLRRRIPLLRRPIIPGSILGGVFLLTRPGDPRVAPRTTPATSAVLTG